MAAPLGSGRLSVVTSGILMPTRTLLCVEPDEAALAVIAGTLEPYGFEIKNITNGDQVVEWAKKNRPALMMVSVEPKKVGYAICNKIKRNVELKDVPLILTSGEEAPEKFDQHKTFKLRADEYMFKPLDRHELMRKVNILIGLDEPETSGAPSPSAEIFLGTNVVSSEIAIDADDIVDEAKMMATPPPQSGTAGAPQDPLGVNPVLDAMFDKEAEAAFDALELPTPEPTHASQGPQQDGPASDYLDVATPPPVETHALPVDMPPSPEANPADPAEPAEPADNDGWAEEGATRVMPASFNPDDLPGMMLPPEPPVDLDAVPVAVAASEPATAEVAVSPVEIEGDPDLLRRAAPPEDVPPLPDEVRNTSVVAYATATANDAAFSDLQKRVHELEDEKRELAAVIDDLRGHLQSQPLHKEKDLLGLRETINRKEKDILDLRDSLDAKDRQILDHKDRMREHERARRDLEEKMLTFEKNLMHASEKAMALAQDKEKGIERERGLKVRLEDAHTEIGKTHDELDLIKKRLATVEDRARLELDRVRQDLEARLAEDEETHKNELGRLREDREAEKASREAEVQAEIGRLNGSHTSEIEMLGKRHAEEKAGLEDAREIELARVRREHDKALQALREEHATALENVKQAHQAALEAKDRDYKNEIAELRRGHDSALAAAEDRRRRELEEAEGRRAADLDTADARRRAELQARDEQHHTATAELERRNLAEKAELAERHRAELEQAIARTTEVETELSARNEELAETHRRLLRVEGELDTARTDIRDREVKVGQARDRITELESKVADLEDQALRAYRRIKDDERTIDKAKRAVSVALTLLDERSTTGTPAAPRPGEESQS
jgi:CheY-like chemotaxis protein